MAAECNRRRLRTLGRLWGSGGRPAARSLRRTVDPRLFRRRAPHDRRVPLLAHRLVRLGLTFLPLLRQIPLLRASQFLSQSVDRQDGICPNSPGGKAPITTETACSLRQCAQTCISQTKQPIVWPFRSFLSVIGAHHWCAQHTLLQLTFSVSARYYHRAGVQAILNVLRKMN